MLVHMLNIMQCRAASMLFKLQQTIFQKVFPKLEGSRTEKYVIVGSVVMPHHLTLNQASHSGKHGPYTHWSSCSGSLTHHAFTKLQISAKGDGCCIQELTWPSTDCSMRAFRALY